MRDSTISVYSMYTRGRRGEKITIVSIIGKTENDLKPPGRIPVVEARLPSI